MSYTKTLVCELSGISLTIIDDFAEGDYSTFRRHPQLENLHHIVEKYKSRAPKSYLAGAILVTLASCNRFARTTHYPKQLMGILNAELCDHDSEFLYGLYEKVNTYCYGKSIVRDAQFNLGIFNTQFGGNNVKWGIVSAIRLLIGDDNTIPQTKYHYAIDIASAQMRKKSRATLTLDDTGKAEKIGNMNIEAVIRRVKELASKARKLNTNQIQEIEQDVEIDVKYANSILLLYPMTAMEIRMKMAILYKRIAKAFPELVKSATQKRSFDMIYERLLDEKTNPVELTDGDAISLDELDLAALDL